MKQPIDTMLLTALHCLCIKLHIYGLQIMGRSFLETSSAAENFRDVSVILVDLGDDKHDVMVSNAGWRDTVAVLRPFGVLDEERLQRLETAWLGQELTQEEARAIGAALVAGPLAAVKWSNDVYPPTGFWRDPGRHPREYYDIAAYWPSWLRAFAGFCLTCKGFIAY